MGYSGKAGRRDKALHPQLPRKDRRCISDEARWLEPFKSTEEFRPGLPSRRGRSTGARERSPPSRQPFEVAEHDRCPVSFRQAPEFFVEHRAQVVPIPILCRGQVGLARGVAPLVEPAPQRCGPGDERNARGHPEQPVTYRASVADRARLARQCQPGGLECVLCVVLVAQDAPADAPYHRSMTRHKRCEGQLGRLAPQGRELLEQRAVAQPGLRPHAEEGMDLP
jgi:hypothetical protein